MNGESWEEDADQRVKAGRQAGRQAGRAAARGGEAGSKHNTLYRLRGSLNLEVIRASRLWFDYNTWDYNFISCL